MKFYKVGKLSDDALERKVEMNPKENASVNILSRLDYLIDFIGKKEPEKLGTFIESLTEIYRSKLQSEKIVDFQDTITKFENLQSYPKLVQLCMMYYIQIINLQDDPEWDDTIEVTNRSSLQSFLHPRYFNLQALINSLGREDAIKLWKQFFTNFIIDTRKPREKPFVDLETMLMERLESEDEGPQDWVVVRGMIGDGKYAFRNDNCLWVDSLDDLPDPEMKYYVCCYGDYEGARNMHPSIIMTMEHTIAQGDPYCSRVLHDTRIDYKLDHPPMEFWDNIKPNEE